MSEGQVTTYSGSVVELLSAPDADGWVRVKRLSDGAFREWHISDLLGVTPEIIAAVAGRKTTKETR